MLGDVKRREELGDFLRTRRARLTPAEVGLTAGAHRRTPGLRREEVAVLAGISETWYTWLERGRDIRPSPQVLESLAQALRLDAHERGHLFMLAQPERFPQPPPDEVVSAALQRFLDSLDRSPAFITGRRTDVLAWNEAADAIYEFSSAPPAERIGVWRIFMNPALRRTEDWENQARLMLSEFRASAARYPGDPSFTDLIQTLAHASPEFRAWWPRHEVQDRPTERREIHHPRAGLLVLERTTLHAHDNPDLKIQIYTPLAEANTAAKIRDLVEQRRDRCVSHLAT